ncbi:hypothetical protein GLOIN_2v1884052 [Rhizophagus irregularis DAOM 181602=DAOM 197198]|uniref:Uncharacterized protein n=3 Tax=Rhizophagus irregularis TaxID=588596 RepID=A0A015IMG6_RHIIW|nr:hypothetical protein GLOIN_2v1884052 [Rhizophagus irregularis DAOM 181602=DAOM 197198]EXX55405.1 hypothetical protein RirG_225660 [Rhizophagus irregularis DAOM 197198w]POG60789.1 hypothetical protein GLOIN_2v1884052 [Rhizophagus irregularis DAOM 181602=DAOM 197198]GBC32193.1 hypothetical protein GLOIN_2v1884052 [Rhizophagus irregularis DAOM 181602=DAOM 197198]|eukprot:XP_025167655.1 hypothetical protein GLOIN_2v1884052 [Rhizophagus irregularis DAOM 181602=DAOM 197198]
MKAIPFHLPNNPNMACSKIFPGDLPEITEEIMQYLRKDFSTLYSCILVNRLWCRLAIPLLWEDPFSAPTRNYHCIKTYSCFFSEDSKAKFNEYEINDNLLISNTLFNYPSFIKYLDIDKICDSIKYWGGTLGDKYNFELGKLIYRSLFEVFIENEGNLNSFVAVLNLRVVHEYFVDNMDLILQNSNLTYNISNLYLEFIPKVIQDYIPFLTFLCSNCKSISSIVFKFFKYKIDNHTLITLIEYLSKIIISQQNLQKISFIYTIKPFLSLKNSNCSNTLNTIIFCYVDFNSIINNLQEVFNQLNVLESIHIIYCHSLNFNFVQQIIKVIKPFKLRSLFMDEILHIESLLLLLQKFSDCLENFGFGYTSEEYNEPKQKLFEFIIKYCKKIGYFESGMPDYDNIYLFIENNQHNSINYLTFDVDYSDNYTLYNKLSSTVLQNLGQVLPSKLEYLCLSLIFMKSDLEIFLKNSQNTFIKKLLFRNIFIEDGNILFCIKKYIIKKERVKYLAILGVDDDVDELFSLKDEVNEFKLHNIIVQSYDDLYISEHDYISNHLQ